jgi:hypothetical protein
MVVAAWALGASELRPRTFGERRAEVIDRTSGTVVARYSEHWVTNEDSQFSDLIRAHRSQLASDFESAWVSTQSMVDNARA